MPHSQVTAEQMKSSAEKFFAWLKKKYPVIDVDLNLCLINAPYLRTKNTFATIYPLKGRSARIEISMARPAPEVLRSIAHEWKHVLQLYKEGIPIEKIKMRQEIAAVGFAAAVVSRYSRAVGENW